MVDTILDKLLVHLATHIDPIEFGLVLSVVIGLLQNRYLQREFAASNRRFDDFVRELARFNRRHTRDDP